MKIRKTLLMLAFAAWIAPSMAQIGTGATVRNENGAEPASPQSAPAGSIGTGATSGSTAAIGSGATSREPAPANIGSGARPAGPVHTGNREEPPVGQGAQPASGRPVSSGPVGQGAQPAYGRPAPAPSHNGDRQHLPRPVSPPAEDPAFHPCEETSGRSATFDQAESAKEVLVVEEFGRTRDVPVAYMMALREIVGLACTERGRHEVVDETTIPGLGVSGAGVLYGAATDPVSWQEQRMAAMARSGARYVITGIVSEYKIAHARTRADKEGFKSAIRLVLTGYDLATATQLETRSYNLVGEGVKAEEADAAAFNSLAGQLVYFLDNNFKFETEILQVGPANKRGKIKECYIHAGTRMGVRPGDLFLVYEVVPMQGVATRQPVGKLRVKRVDDTDSAFCTITKGGEEIARAMQAGDRLIVISDSQALFF